MWQFCLPFGKFDSISRRKIILKKIVSNQSTWMIPYKGMVSIWNRHQSVSNPVLQYYILFYTGYCITVWCKCYSFEHYAQTFKSGLFAE